MGGEQNRSDVNTGAATGPTPLQEKPGMQRRIFCLALVAGVALAAGSWAQEKGQGGKPAWTDPATAPIDFKLQGEYVGKVRGQKLGAQVIALGNGTFQAVFLPGGLPGEGWDTTTRIRVNGKVDGEAAVFPEICRQVTCP